MQCFEEVLQMSLILFMQHGEFSLRERMFYVFWLISVVSVYDLTFNGKGPEEYKSSCSPLNNMRSPLSQQEIGGNSRRKCRLCCATVAEPEVFTGRLSAQIYRPTISQVYAMSPKVYLLYTQLSLQVSTLTNTLLSQADCSLMRENDRLMIAPRITSLWRTHAEFQERSARNSILG